MKVRIETDSNGYITSWGTDYTSNNMTDLDESELNKVVLMASKLVDGHIVVDQDKISQINAENDAAQKKLEQDQVTVDSLKQQNDLLQSAVMELSNYVFSLPSDSNDSTTGSAS